MEIFSVSDAQDVNENDSMDQFYNIFLNIYFNHIRLKNEQKLKTINNSQLLNLKQCERN